MLDAKTQEMVRMWNADMTATEIAEVLGWTKGQVIGRVFRLRAKGVELRAREFREPKVQKPPPDKMVRVPNVCFKPVPLPPIERPPLVRKPVTLLDLTPDACRYIVSGERTSSLFCGAPQEVKSYCAAHAAICYTKEKSCSSRTRSRRSNYMRTVRYGITTRGLSKP